MAIPNVHTQRHIGSRKELLRMIVAYRLPLFIFVSAVALTLGYNVFFIHVLKGDARVNALSPTLFDALNTYHAQLYWLTYSNTPTFAFASLFVGNTFFVLMFWSFLRAVFTCAGYVPPEPWRWPPKTDPERQRVLREEWARQQQWLRDQEMLAQQQVAQAERMRQQQQQLWWSIHMSFMQGQQQQQQGIMQTYIEEVSQTALAPSGGISQFKPITSQEKETASSGVSSGSYEESSSTASGRSRNDDTPLLGDVAETSSPESEDAAEKKRNTDLSASSRIGVVPSHPPITSTFSSAVTPSRVRTPLTAFTSGRPPLATPQAMQPSSAIDWSRRTSTSASAQDSFDVVVTTPPSTVSAAPRCTCHQPPPIITTTTTTTGATLSGGFSYQQPTITTVVSTAAAAMAASDSTLNPAVVHEYEADGSVRFCEPCHQYKPDNSHHCRACQRCVLDMDHHCHFLNNCVGRHNYKFFFLCIFYSTLCGTVNSALFLCAYVGSAVCARWGNAWWWVPAGMSAIGICVTFLWVQHVFLLVRGVSTLDRMAHLASERFLAKLSGGRVMGDAWRSGCARDCVMTASECVVGLAKMLRQRVPLFSSSFSQSRPSLNAFQMLNAPSLSQAGSSAVVSQAERRARRIELLFGRPRYVVEYFIPITPRCPHALADEKADCRFHVEAV